MKSKFTVVAGLVASLGVGCGLVKVNGKPVTVGSSSSPSNSESNKAESTAEPRAAAKETSNPASSPTPSAGIATEPAAQPAAAAAPAPAEEPGKQLEDVPEAPAHYASWSPVQQYKKLLANDSYSSLIIADELGDRLSQAGRLAVVRTCFAPAHAAASSAALWAICEADVEALKLDSALAELKKEGIDKDVRAKVLEDGKKALEHARAVGAAVAAAAKDDPGVAAIVAMGKTARSEWRDFASAHAGELATLAALQDLTRDNKNGLAKDCVAKTYEPFAKVVRKTKFSQGQIGPSPLAFYVNSLPKTTEAHIAALAWGACALLVDRSGAAMYTAAGTTIWATGWGRRARRFLRRGPRSLTLAKLFDEKFEPKFADRSLMMGKMTQPYGEYHVGGPGNIDGTPLTSVVAKLIKNGDTTTVKGKDYNGEECANWQDTNKVYSVDSNGTVHYEKKCTRYERVRYEASDVVSAPTFLNGVTPGLELTAVDGYPVVGIKGRRIVFALGVPMKP